MHLLKKKVLFSALMLVLGLGLVANQATAQKKTDAKLYGQVVDASGQAVSGVNVTLQGADKKATTGDKGMYAIKSLEAGTYTVVVKADGYKKWEKEVKVTKKGKMVNVNLKNKEG